MAEYVAAIDQGTTSSRLILFDKDGRIQQVDQREHEQITPKAGWVEHDATEDLAAHARGDRRGDGELRRRGRRRQGDRDHQPARDHRGLGPRDRRAGLQRDRLAGHADRRHRRRSWPATRAPDRLRKDVGLPLSTYFSGPKIKWILDNVDGARKRAEAGELAFGNMDTWVLWNLTGGTDGGVHATDVTNASRGRC